MPIYQYILKRVLIAIPTLLIVSMISFAIMRLEVHLPPLSVQWGGQAVQLFEGFNINPIDPLAELRLNPAISKAALEQERARRGLDKPAPIQYWLWLKNLLQFNPKALVQGHLNQFFTPNLGLNFSGESVAHILAQRLPNTILLNLVTITVIWLIAIPLGIYAALNWRTRLDTLLTIFSSTGMAAPSFVIALLLGFVAVKTGIAPYGGLTSVNFEEMNFLEKLFDLAHHLVLPVTVLSIGGIAGLQRQMRGNLLDVLEAEYVRVARAKGLPEHKVIYKHAVRTAINPLVTMFGFEFGTLLSGSAIVEMVLQYPGIGQLALEAARQTDTNMVMSVMLLGATMLLLGNLLGDILLKVVDPRIELA
ncbi:MAG: ABC transporter permease [Cyanobacteria bacterium HKST-UBA06]|nr:ABC transporter permease [Cyanobacteria bacterium HKST-UBA06]